MEPSLEIGGTPLRGLQSSSLVIPHHDASSIRRPGEGHNAVEVSPAIVEKWDQCRGQRRTHRGSLAEREPDKHEEPWDTFAQAEELAILHLDPSESK